jgi:predicted phosphodiesterase
MAAERLEAGLIVPDTHAPYHDVDAWALMMDVAQDLEPSTVVVLGDLVDFYSISSHSKDPRRKMTLEQEVAAACELRAELDSLGADHKVFVEGNHETRLERYLSEKAPELFGLADVGVLLELESNGWEHVAYRDSTRIGKVHYTHDIGKAGRYSTYQTLDAYQHSVVFGHSHRLCYVVEGDATGKAKVGVQFGWLGDPRKADYMHRVKANREWATGFGISYTDTQTGHVFLQPVPIVDKRCVVNGKLYNAPARRRRATRTPQREVI